MGNMKMLFTGMNPLRKNNYDLIRAASDSKMLKEVFLESGFKKIIGSLNSETFNEQEYIS